MPPAPTEFPRYVRWLAVLYYLSYLIGPIGFIIALVAAGIRWTWLRQLDWWVSFCLLAGLAIGVACPVFRAWFKRWGEKRWPEPDSVDPK